MFKPAIVIASYNRPESLKRLLHSIYNGHYPYNDITLIISIDYSEKQNEIEHLAKEFSWEYGNKRIILHSINLGLRQHIIKCGDLTSIYEAIIMLEDDLYVSPMYYHYSLSALDFFKDEPKIAGISLCNYNHNGFSELPFYPIDNGFDNYFIQIPSSLGQVWTKSQWNSFLLFYNANPKISEDDKFPDLIKKWPDTSWKKYFQKYMVEFNLFFVCPYVSLSTCMGDTGTHIQTFSKEVITTLNLFSTSPKFNFVNLSATIIKYDAYFELLPEAFKFFGFKPDLDFCVDLNGIKQLDLFIEEYWLTSKSCFNSLECFEIRLTPIENNIISGLMTDRKRDVLNFTIKSNINGPTSFNAKKEIASFYNQTIYNIGAKSQEVINTSSCQSKKNIIKHFLLKYFILCKKILKTRLFYEKGIKYKIQCFNK